MTKEFKSLSDYIEDNVQRGNFISSMIHVNKIKEFIKIIRNLGCICKALKYTSLKPPCKYCRDLNKAAGPKLITKS